MAHELAPSEVSHSVRVMKGGCFLKLERGGVKVAWNPRGKQGPKNGTWEGLQTKELEANSRKLCPETHRRGK